MKVRSEGPPPQARNSPEKGGCIEGLENMKVELVKWTELRPGDLFRSRDDLYPLRVLHVLDFGVLVQQGGRFWKVYFRPGVRVMRFG